MSRILERGGDMQPVEYTARNIGLTLKRRTEFDGEGEAYAIWIASVSLGGRTTAARSTKLAHAIGDALALMSKEFRGV